MITEEIANYWRAIPKQTLLKENGEIGDCLRCCIAAILNRPAKSVPHFVAEHGHEGIIQAARWLRINEFWMLQADRITEADWDCPVEEDIPLIVCGPSPRSTGMGQYHAVIKLQGEIVYDPHPSEAGLTAEINAYAIVPRLTTHYDA